MLKNVFIIGFISLLYPSAGYGQSGQNASDKSGAGSFDFHLYRAISQQNLAENIVFSPFTIQVLLALIYARSTGKLAHQLQAVLQFAENRTRNSLNFENMFNALDNNRAGVTLLMANALYYNQNYGALSTDARNLAQYSFGSDVKELDFFRNVHAANYINFWVAQKTQQLIQNIITPDSIDQRTHAILINAIYFKGEWQMPFSKDNTERKIFHKLNGQEILTDMMSDEDVFLYGYSNDLKTQILELPYKSSTFSMMILLPMDRYGLYNLQRQLHRMNLKDIRMNLKREEVQVTLPKFQFEFNQDLSNSLKQLGLTSLFNEEAEIHLFDKQTELLFVDRFHHKAIIKVNEAGTEAAAASFIKLTALSLPINVNYFVADHPFIFLIHNTKTVFFMGHLLNP